MTPRCLVCDAPLSIGASFDGGCMTCVGGVWAEALALGDARERIILAAIFRELGMLAHERCLTRVPFGAAAFDGEGLRDHE